MDQKKCEYLIQHTKMLVAEFEENMAAMPESLNREVRKRHPISEEPAWMHKSYDIITPYGEMMEKRKMAGAQTV